MAIYLQSDRDTTDLTTYTFTAENLGTADAAHYIIVTIAHRAASNRSISSVTIGGVSATIVTQPTNLLHTVGIAIALVPTGTTGDVVIVLSGAAQRLGISVYRAIGINPTPTDTQTSTSIDPQATLNVPANGIAVGVAISLTNSTLCTWTGLTEDNEEVIEAVIDVTSASLETVSALPTLAVKADFVTNSSQVGAFVSWGPAAGGAALGNYPYNLGGVFSVSA